jgi:hypothetical protein
MGTATVGSKDGKVTLGPSQAVKQPGGGGCC